MIIREDKFKKISSGILPVKLFKETRKYCNLESLASPVGMLPIGLFSDKVSSTSEVKFPKNGGIVPER